MYIEAKLCSLFFCHQLLTPSAEDIGDGWVSLIGDNREVKRKKREQVYLPPTLAFILAWLETKQLLLSCTLPLLKVVDFVSL